MTLFGVFCLANIWNIIEIIKKNMGEKPCLKIAPAPSNISRGWEIYCRQEIEVRNFWTFFKFIYRHGFLVSTFSPVELFSVEEKIKKSVNKRTEFSNQHTDKI